MKETASFKTTASWMLFYAAFIHIAVNQPVNCYNLWQLILQL